MKHIELTAYCVREYDVKYTMVLPENDPIIQEILINNDMTFEQLSELPFADMQELWDIYMSLPANEIDIDEDFAPAEERFVDFDTFITERENV